MTFKGNYQRPALHETVLTGRGGFPNGYLLQAWPLARSPQLFFNASILIT